MSRYKPYPVYKDSGVEWIEKVPEHWKRASVKYVLSTAIADGPHETPVFIDKGIEFLSVDGIQDGELVFDGKRFISIEDHARFCRKAKPQLDDVLVGKSASVGKVARVKTVAEFNVWSPLAILRPSQKKCLPAYLEFALKADSSQQQIMLAGNTSTQANIGMERLASVGIPLPSTSEQQTLTRAIDRETARIDALISRKTRFIELLQEKRQALITHTVTKGLDPNVKMKDSGVEWIWEVPEHWEIAPVKAISKTLNGATPESAKADYWDGDIAWYTPTDIDNEIAKELGPPRRYISQAGFDSCAVKLAPADSVVLSTRAPIGSVGITLIPSTINQGCRTLVPTKSISGKFVACVLVAARDELRLRGNGTTFQELSTDSLRSLRVPLPPADERKWITDHIDRETSLIDALIAKTQRSIDLIKERRSAFITAAVTGQIDLRDE